MKRFGQELGAPSKKTVLRTGVVSVNRPIILDAGPLGRIAHPRPNRPIVEWFQRLLDSDIDLVVAEIADYEVRRNLILEGLVKSVARLDDLKQALTYLPLTTEIMLKAAELWAEARKAGTPTADPSALDCDVILAAQALSIDAVIATENIGHLSRFVDAYLWKDILPS